MQSGNPKLWGWSLGSWKWKLEMKLEMKRCVVAGQRQRWSACSLNANCSTTVYVALQRAWFAACSFITNPACNSRILITVKSTQGLQLWILLYFYIKLCYKQQKTLFYSNFSTIKIHPAHMHWCFHSFNSAERACSVCPPLWKQRQVSRQTCSGNVYALSMMVRLALSAKHGRGCGSLPVLRFPPIVENK